MVRRAVAKVELTFSIPIFAKTAVIPAKNADPKAKNNQSISFPSFKFSQRKVLRNTEDRLHTAGIPGIQVCTAAKRDTSWRGVPALDLTASLQENYSSVG